MSDALERRKAQLDKARTRLERARVEVERTRAKSEGATPGGLTDYDPALLSGIRRKANRKADDRRYNAYSREANAVIAVDDALLEVARLERIIAQMEAPRPTLEDIQAATAIRTNYGWHRVLRVNAKSVTVATGFSWNDRIPLKDILEART